MTITDYLTDAEVHAKYDFEDVQTEFYLARCVAVKVGKQKYYDKDKLKEVEEKLKCRE